MTLQGLVIGQYRLTGKLGEGGMGVVYAAEHTLLGRQAAVKVLLPELSSKQEVVQRFFNEARAATAIRHPGIVEIYDFGWTSEGAAFIVMEHLEGESLRARKKRGQMLWPVALALTRQIAGALGAAHAKGIVHRDLKPDNVFLVADPEVPGGERIKLLDFGIAKLANPSSGKHMTRTGAVIGTPTYMAPEQCRGVAVDSRADLYSLGCILFELCSGRPPFEGEGEGDVLAAHIHMPVPRLSSRATGVPKELEALLERMLAKAPADRVQTAEEVIRLIDAAIYAITGFPRESSVAAAAAYREPSVAAAPAYREPSVAAAPAAPAATPAHREPSVAVTPQYPSIPSGTIYSETTLSSAVSWFRLPPRRSPRRRLVVLGAAAVALGVGAAIITIVAGGKDKVPATTASAASGSVAMGSSEADAPPGPPPPVPMKTTAKVEPPPPAAPKVEPPPPVAPKVTAEVEPPPPAPAKVEPPPPAPAVAAKAPPKEPPPPVAKAPPKPPAKAVVKRRPEPQEAPAPATVDVVIDSLPAGAEVVRNGAVIGKTPYRGTLPRSSRDVQLVLRLRGYAPKPITVDTGAASKQHVKLVPVVHNQSVNPF